MYIEKISGTYLHALPTGVIVDVHGIGYGLEVPLSTLCRLPPIGEPVALWTYTHVREDAIRLFGFARFEDRLAFEIMLGISGVGPKVALAILSTLTVHALRQAVELSRPEVLETVPGVGRRLAEKVLLELKPKLSKLKPSRDLGFDQDHQRLDEIDDGFLDADDDLDLEGMDKIFDDLRSALENLGFKDKQINPLVKNLRSHFDGHSFQDILKLALRKIGNPDESTPSSSSKKQPKKKVMAKDRIDQELF